MSENPQPWLTAKAWFVLGLAALLLVLSIVCAYLFFADRTPSPGAMAFVSTAFFIASAWFAIYGILIDARMSVSFAFPAAIDEAAARVQDLRRDYNRAVTSVEDVQAVVTREMERVEALAAEMRRDGSQIGEAESRLAEEISSRHEAQEGLRQWQDRTASVVRGVERLVSMQGASEDYVAGAEKVLASLERHLGPVGLTIVRPTPGDRFDDLLHQPTGEEEHPSLAPGSVARALSWGLVVGDVRERAEVLLVAARTSGS